MEVAKDSVTAGIPGAEPSDESPETGELGSRSVLDDASCGKGDAADISATGTVAELSGVTVAARKFADGYAADMCAPEAEFAAS